ncbi:alpha/beta fold hydrolase [Streptomyces sp. NBC_01317]|uniref:thioesterase II family protein n=1 Tax=Streptomyces sp. NBC_01317 TaxID=2903822 RepID=UPI002E120A48|nr:alpha/beta fold hydrolase [Streptomyces sp. NBC_01317]
MSEATHHPSTWLQCAVPVADPRWQLICFPHAGGSASFFRDWGHHLPGVRVHAVRYPGRAERLAEPVPTDLRDLARATADAVAALPGVPDLPLALFGHSMGAAVALETARALEARGITPAHLIASGSRDAPYPPPEPAAEIDEDDAEVVTRLITLGGTDPELAADPVFQELVLPYIRGDSHMFHSYIPRPEPLLRCPVTTIVGDADPDADRRPWSELTGGGFREQRVPGDHFYLVPEPPYALVLNSVAAPAEH